MKTKISFALSLLVGSLFACNGPHFGLALNQRSFYNPASLCPYCKGSTFMASGLNFTPGLKNENGIYYAFGNDQSAVLHGPFDFSYATSKSSGTNTKAFSLRYAYAIQMGNWKAAVGMRISHYSIRESIKIPGMETAKSSSKLFDADAGIMVTNEKGLYVGISILHLGSPNKISSTENGFSNKMELDQTLEVMSGYVQRINDKWDVLPDLSFMNNKNESAFQSGMMLRFLHHYSIGSGVTFTNAEKPGFELRGGYMSSKFKWLMSASKNQEGWSVETGIVWRFWFAQECNGTCTPKVIPWKKKDDFVKHR